MKAEQLEIMRDIRDSRGLVDDAQFTAAERKTLRELAKIRLVALSWRLTAHGEQRLKEKPQP